ncbi:ATP-binding protein [soil metagenome]
MRHFSYVFITFIFYYNSVKAQPPAIDSLQKSINGNSTTSQKINAYKLLADYFSTKKFDECIDLSLKGIRLAEKVKDINAVCDFKNYIGLSYYLKGDYDSAAILYYQALDLNGKARDLKGKAAILNNLGRLYRKTKNLDRALQNYDEAFSIYSKQNDEDGMATILNESGVVYEYKEDYKEAIGRYEQSLAIRIKKNDLLGKSYSLNFIGTAYSEMKDYKKAETYLINSLEIRKQLHDTFSLALSYSDLADMYNKKGDYNSATASYAMSNEIANQMKYPQLQVENYATLSSIEEKKGNNALSLQYFKKSTALKDSIINVDKIKQIEYLNAKFQAEKKEQQLQMQQYELQRKNYLLGGMLAILALLVFSGFSFYRRRQVQQSLTLQKAIVTEQDIATKAIIVAEENERKRIAADLHDGIGQMMSAAKMNLSVFENELRFTSQEQKTSFENVIGLIDESCKEIRSVSHQMMPNALLKSGLASAVKEFIEKIDTRIIKVSMHAEGLNERIDYNTETVLYRVVQECVNNVLKHAHSNQLDISLIKDADGISVTIEDNGIGFNSSDKLKFEGIGLKNIISRIKYLKGSIEFDSSPGKGTLVAIHVPIG